MWKTVAGVCDSGTFLFCSLYFLHFPSLPQWDFINFVIRTKVKNENALHTPEEVTREESEPTHWQWKGGGGSWWERFSPLFFPLSVQSSFVDLIIKPTAQGATVPRLLAVCLPPAYLTSAKSSSHGPRSKHEFIMLGSPVRTTQACRELCVPLSGECPETLECLPWPTSPREPGLGPPCPGTSLSFSKPSTDGWLWRGPWGGVWGVKGDHAGPFLPQGSKLLCGLSSIQVAP